MKTLLYIDGEPVREFWAHPAIRPAVNALAATYDLASNAHPLCHCGGPSGNAAAQFPPHDRLQTRSKGGGTSGRDS
jgi:aromatic ring hydroxylase